MKLNSLQLRVPPTEGRDVSPSRQKRKNPRIPSIRNASEPHASVLSKAGTVRWFSACHRHKVKHSEIATFLPEHWIPSCPARSYRLHRVPDGTVANVVANGDDQCVDGVKKSKGQRQQTYLLPAQHPAVKPVRKTPGMGRGSGSSGHSTLERSGNTFATV